MHYRMKNTNALKNILKQAYKKSKAGTRKEPITTVGCECAKVESWFCGDI